VLRNPEFRVLWAAELLSVAGDQLARVALAVLVFGRTGSAAWAAGTYALTFLPALAGGVLLSGLADRYRRREVMIVCDVVRVGLVAVMAVPQLPLGVLGALLVVVTLLGAPHTAAQGALLPAVLPGEAYERGLAVRQITGQTAQLVGFAAGGVLVGAIGPAPALLVDAATFALSAALVRLGVADRPPPARPGPPGARVAGPLGNRAVWAGVIEIATDPRRRALVLLAWLVGCYVVPEALAAPYAQQIGAGTSAVGLLMAADPLGSVIGAWLFVRFVPAARRDRLIGVLAVGAGLPLLGTALLPNVPLAVLLWGLSGMASTAYLLQAQASFVRETPDRGRGRAIGVAASGIIAAQGLAMLAGGLLADQTSPSTSVAVTSAAGMVAAAGGAIAWHRACREGRASSPTTVVVG
jgi:MFS family permease